jgi:hypothetical protein
VNIEFMVGAGQQGILEEEQCSALAANAAAQAALWATTGTSRASEAHQLSSKDLDSLGQLLTCALFVHASLPLARCTYTRIMLPTICFEHLLHLRKNRQRCLPACQVADAHGL